MLPKLFFEVGGGESPKMYKEKNGRDVSRFGAFACGDIVDFHISVPRKTGAAGVVMRICEDGREDHDIPMEYEGCEDDSTDLYKLTLDTAKLCGKSGYGLFYYCFLFLRGYNTLFSDSINNIDFELSEREGFRFRMLIYEKDYKTPEWFGSGVMYHIFVDRFNRGNGHTAMKRGAVMNPDWEHGIPEYAEEPGGFVANNEFFGGNLQGIIDKLDYLSALGVRVIYLSPIFEAASNHKYDTGDYSKIDCMFGSEEDFRELISKAGERGIKLILDGVFNHTGDDSLYFNRRGNYGAGGAYNDEDSPYRNWYKFKNGRDEYETWWGIDILPKLNHSCDSCRDFLAGKDGIAAKYAKMGIGGWRLDVADELSNQFLDELRESVKNVNGDAVIIGEVWENAADKIAYGARRRYLAGKQLDSVMNYPIRQGILSFVRYGDAEGLYDVLTELYSSYPRCVSDSLMNLVGTHDTDRVFTLLGSDEGDGDLPNSELAVARLTPEKREKAVKLLKIASCVQFTVFGIPSVFYGDEIGMEGWHDPFCRMPFPWHELDSDYRTELLDHYRKLGMMRNTEKVFDHGDFNIFLHTASAIGYSREKDGQRIDVIANMGDVAFDYPLDSVCTELLTGKKYGKSVTVAEKTAVILKYGKVGS